MEDSKTLLFYLFGLAGLIIVAVLFTGRIESPGVEPLPAMTMPTITKISPTVNSPKIDQKTCPSITQEITLGYLPDIAALEGNRLVISGVVYASDFTTPLPGALIEVWRATPENQYEPRSLYTFHHQLETDAAGYYEFTTYKPDRYDIVRLHYRVSYQDYCSLGLQLFLVGEPVLDDSSLVSPTLRNLDLEQVKPTGPLLRGPLDIVLPVPPSAP